VARARFATAALLLAAVVITFLLFRSLRHDDAYITFQFARNVATGAGFVFNEGERVLGTSSPLSTLALSVVYAIGGDVIPSAAVLLGAAALVAQAALLWLLLRRQSTTFAALAALLTWLGLAGSHAWLALETNLTAALLLATLVALQHERATLAGLLLGLAFLTRHDAVLLVPVVVAGQWTRTRTLPVKTLAVAALAVLPWLAWAASYFGSFVPNTLHAKQQLTAPGAYILHYAEHFASQPWTALGLPPVAAIASPLLWLLGVVHLGRLRGSRLVEFLAYGLLLSASYAWIGPPAEHHWHLYPATLALALIWLAGLVQLATWSGKASPALARARALPRSLAAVLVLLAAANAFRFARAVPSEPRFGGRDRSYAAIAEWVRDHVKPDQSFLAIEIGTLGYLTRLRMIDACGLINATNEFPRTHSLDEYVALMARYRPDLVLLNTPEHARYIERLTRYQTARRFVDGPVLLVRSADVLSDPAPPGRGASIGPPAQPRRSTRSDGVSYDIIPSGTSGRARP
jgi:hypothetical protein